MLANDSASLTHGKTRILEKAPHVAKIKRSSLSCGSYCLGCRVSMGVGVQM